MAESEGGPSLLFVALGAGGLMRKIAGHSADRGNLLG
jgi:hypothetical protein